MKFRCLILMLVAANTVFAADYGVFKSEWNTIVLNTNITAIGTSFSSKTLPFHEIYAETNVFVRYISFKCISSKPSSDWKEALRGVKTYYCAVRIDGDETEDNCSIIIHFTDANGLDVHPVEEDLDIRLISDGGGSEAMTFAPTLSHGAPVSFRLSGTFIRAP